MKRCEPSCLRNVRVLPLAVATAWSLLALATSAQAQDQPVPHEGGTVFVTNLQGILVVPAKEGAKTPQELLANVNPAGVTGIRGVVVKGPPFLQAADFERLLSKYLGHPLSSNSLAQMQVDIVRFSRTHDHRIVDVFTSEQDILDNTIQIAVIEGRIGNITVTNAFHKWFSDNVILRDIRLKPGDTVRESRLNSDLAWLNRNNYQSLGYDGFSAPFRDVEATFRQGNLGQTDLELQVEDRFPFRPFVGGDDTGIDVIGRDRVFAGFNWANAFGLDHRLNYEYLTDTHFHKFREHVGSYVIPLPWRHELTFFGAYAEVNPDFSVVDPTLASLQNRGTYWQVSGRYSIPLPSFRKYDHEISAGFDFKRTDTPLLFEGSTAGLLRTNNIDIAQFVVGYFGRLNDSLGRTAFSLQGVFSPGGMTTHNHLADYQDFAPGSNPHYLYGRAELRRQTRLPWDFSWYTRAMGQLSDAKLVATEAFSIGGYDTVRGYDERIVSGDNGWVVVNELRTPPLILGNLTGKANAHDWIEGHVFCDYGGAINRNPLVNQRYEEVLLSVGLGLRYQVADNFRVRFDYGFQLDREYLSGPNAAFLGHPSDRRAHFGVELSF